MKFMATAYSDVGISKTTNQDSVLVKHATCDLGEVLMAIVCDGMGGLAKGELASATVIRAFNRWFDEELPHELENPDFNVIGAKWSLLLKELNVFILEYSRTIGAEGMGTTFSGILLVENEYVIVHVGDSRIYHIDSRIEQLTNDHTFVAREISKGAMTEEQAKTDKRRNLLLQCVGASQIVEPDIITGNTNRGIYLLCSDGFRHKITEEEMLDALNPINLWSKEAMSSSSKSLVEQIKLREEKDNISVVLIKAE